jgi:hypothetical protein
MGKVGKEIAKFLDFTGAVATPKQLSNLSASSLLLNSILTI